MGLTNKELLDFLERDYERKIEQLHRHLLSIWTRFNFFISFEGLIIGAKFLTNKISDSDIAYDFSGGICFLGLVSGTIWYCFSANDRYLVKVYRNHVEEAFEKLNDFLKKICTETETFYCEDFDMSVCSKKTVKPNLFGWRYSRLGLTDYATMVPLTIILFWVGYIIHNPAIKLFHLVVNCFN